MKEIGKSIQHITIVKNGKVLVNKGFEKEIFKKGNEIIEKTKPFDNNFKPLQLKGLQTILSEPSANENLFERLTKIMGKSPVKKAQSLKGRRTTPSATSKKNTRKRKRKKNKKKKKTRRRRRRRKKR
jgi:hypothetical protein